MDAPTLPRGLLDRLQALFSHSFSSAAAYVFESEPYRVPEDEGLLASLGTIRDDDRRHARMLADVIESFDAVPQAGAFAYWNRDLNYLAVPHLARFVLRTLREDLERVRSLLGDWPADQPSGRAMLEAMARDKEQRIRQLDDLTRMALEREADRYRKEIETARAARDAVLAEQKAAAEAARMRKAAPKAPPAGAKPSPKERARQQILKARGQAPGEAAAKTPAKPDTEAPVPDPNEKGISAKEKARRQILAMRAKKAEATTEAAAPEEPPARAPQTLDPNEPGIPPKEKARRQILALRAKQGKPAPPTAAEPKPETPDPDEPGITSKERARRQILRMRAKREGAKASPSSRAKDEAKDEAKAQDDALLDPDEPGISPKEKARRQILRMRAQKKDA
ncbi:MAG: hypothetical protein ACYTG6_00455 [Planctomycetota bacterium]